MNLKKVTFDINSKSAKDADGNDFQIWSQIHRLREIEVAHYCLYLLKIFKQNPTVDSLKLIGEVVQEYDDNNYFTDVHLLDLRIADKTDQEIEVYTVDGELFSTQFDWDDEDETEDGETIFAWNVDEGYLISNRYDLMHFFEQLGRTTISITRESVEHFLSDPIDFDELYQVLVPSSKSS